MAKGNNLHLDDVKKYSSIIKDTCARIYRPGMSTQGPVQIILDYVGNKNAAIGAAILAFLITVWSFSLFSILFAIMFAITATILIFVGTKIIFYKPQEVSIELDDENTILSYVKEVHLNGESEIIIHSQPGYGKNKNTFLLVQLFDSISILDCRNITSITDKSYHDIDIQFFHPIEGEYTVGASSDEGSVGFEVISQTADNCRVNFLSPVRKTVKLELNPV